MRATMLVPSTASKTLVCVDGLKDGDILGRLYNMYMPKPVKFASAYDFIKAMESFFDKIGFPQAVCEERRFTPKAKAQPRKSEKSEVRQYMSEEIFDIENGKKATFVVQVQFRQNGTWQGTITWTEGKKTQRFRSSLEMVKLMDEAAGEKTGPGVSW